MDMVYITDLMQIPSGLEFQRLFYGRPKVHPTYQDWVIDSFNDKIVIMIYGKQEEVQELLEVNISKLKDKFPSYQIVIQIRQGKIILWMNEKFEFLEESEEIASEGDVRFLIQLGKNQNHGIFPDFLPVRDWLRSNCTNKKVLNLFCYTSIASIYALMGGASQVLNVDEKQQVLDWSKRNGELNRLFKGRNDFFKSDVMKSIGLFKRKGPFDIIIADPPARQDSFSMSKDYPKLIRRLPEFMPNGGVAILTNNDPFVSEEEFKKTVSLACSDLIFEKRILPSGIEFWPDLNMAPKFMLYRLA